MKKILPFVLIISMFKLALAQGDEVTSLKFNPALYAQTKIARAATTHTSKYLVSKGNTIITTDTLTLPFIDDFSSNREPSYKYVEEHRIDSFFNVTGGCLVNEGVAYFEDIFTTTPSWNYTWDVAHQRVDSTAKQPISFIDFGPATSQCFSNTPVSKLYWPAYYTYTFDSTSGQVIDSAIVAGNGVDTVSLIYASKIYFATGQHGTLWFDNFAYINNTYPINPPTIGVATLDALDEFGVPYSNVSGATGTADYLTSNPINIETLSESDSVYLSFFFEPQGYGDYPDYVDSLIVEFKDNSGTWNIMWADTGYRDPLSVPDTFQQVIIKVPTLPIPYNFFTNTFQFRFRNIASLYGNNNHWHIDYVKMDKNRSVTDTVLHDMAFVYPFPNILKNFTQEPAVQFNNPGDLNDNVKLIIHNLDPNGITNPPATNFGSDATETYPTQAIVLTQQLRTFNAAPSDTLTISPSSYTIPALNADSLSITSRAFIIPNDSRPQNDTLTQTLSFGNVLAYDDGSAEKAYGLTGGQVDVKKFGYEFVLNKPDTLVGFQVMFTTVEANVSDLIFNFDTWDSIRLNDISFIDTPKLIIYNQKPFYIDSVNGFATYKIDPPYLVDHKIYFGWSQSDNRRLQIGYDMNDTLGYTHMFIYTGGTWKQSTATPVGSPMIRLLFDSSFTGLSSIEAGLPEVKADNETLSMFPNPTNGYLNFKSSDNATFDVYVVNAVGQNVIHNSTVTQSLDLGELPMGIYIITARNLQTGKTYRNKIIKSAF